MTAGATVIVDTGPLVALFDPSDNEHARCETALARLEGRALITTLAIVTEVTYLLGFSGAAQRSFLAFIAAGAIDIAEFTATDVSRAAALMERFADLPMDFADASLVVLAERLRTHWVFTLDRRDFGIYRVGRRAFRILPA